MKCFSDENVGEPSYEGRVSCGDAIGFEGSGETYPAISASS